MVLLYDGAYSEAVIRSVWRVGQHVILRQRVAGLVLPKDILDAAGVAHRWHVCGINLLENLEALQDVGQLRAEDLNLSLCEA